MKHAGRSIDPLPQSAYGSPTSNGTAPGSPMESTQSTWPVPKPSAFEPKRSLLNLKVKQAATSPGPYHTQTHSSMHGTATSHASASVHALPQGPPPKPPSSPVHLVRQLSAGRVRPGHMRPPDAAALTPPSSHSSSAAGPAGAAGPAASSQVHRRAGPGSTGTAGSASSPKPSRPPSQPTEQKRIAEAGPLRSRSAGSVPGRSQAHKPSGKPGSAGQAQVQGQQGGAAAAGGSGRNGAAGSTGSTGGARGGPGGPSTPEEGIRQCLATISRETWREQRRAVSVESIIAVHRINYCFMAARSLEHAVELAELAAMMPSSLRPASQQEQGQEGRQQQQQQEQDGSQRAISLSAPGLQQSHPLLGLLIELVGSGEPHAMIALHTLTYLTCSPRVLLLLGQAGLVPLLVGQMRLGSALEPLLLSSSLGLLAAVIAADAQDVSRPLLHANLRGVAAAAVSVGDERNPECRRAALQLLKELVMVRKGAHLIVTMASLTEAVDKALQLESADVAFVRDLQQVRKLAALLGSSEAQPPGPRAGE